MKKDRLQIYSYDLFHRGLSYFISSRLKKHPLLRQLYYLFRSSFVYIGKYKLFIDKSDTVVSESLINHGVWEPDILHLFQKYIRPGNTIVEIGAHIGDFTLSASQAVGPKGKVFAFEPSSHNLSFLRKSLSENRIQNVTLIPKAVSNKSGQINLYLSKDNQGDHRTYNFSTQSATETVKTVSLNDYFTSLPTIHFLKIDIQGSEFQALLGMSKLLQKRKIKILVSELYPEGLKQAGSSWQKYLKLLQKSGFNIYQIPSLAPINFDDIKKYYKDDPEFTTNIIGFLHNNKHH